MSKETFLIVATRPEAEQGTIGKGRYFGGINGVSSVVMTKNAQEAEKHPTREAAQERIAKLFAPAYYAAVEVMDI